jgi:hypothetical protein
MAEVDSTKYSSYFSPGHGSLIARGNSSLQGWGLSRGWSGLPGRRLPSVFQLVALKFKRSYVTAGFVFFIRAWHATLIGLQQVTLAVGAATGVARINRWTARKKSLRLCRTAVVLKGTYD